jgi:alpha-beta hydrolase superfamily lysophospholipase
MCFIEETVTGSDGLRLYLRRHDVKDARAEVIISHGFGEHSGRYGALTEHLMAQGFSVTVYDHRGHGLSDGLPGHVESFTEYEEDLDHIVSAVRARSDASSVFLIAHSMGALVALRYVAKRGSRLAGAVISAPLIAVAMQVPTHKIMIARVGSRVAPRMRMDNEIDPSVLSRDPEVGRAYISDPLVHRVVSARWFSEASRAMDEVKEWAPQITLPILVMHGTEDRLASVDATRDFFERIGSADKELGIYEGYYHELFNEPEKEQLYSRVSEWLLARTA